MTDDYTPAEVARALIRIEQGQKDVLDKVDKLTDRFVPADVFALRVGAVEREVKELKVSVEGRKVSGWTIAAVIVAIVATAAALIPALAK